MDHSNAGPRLDDCEDDSNDIEVAIAKEAIHQHFSVDVALAVAKVESGMKQSARGSRGEIGLFQIMPANANHMNILNVKNNIRRGIELLKEYESLCSDMGKYYVICYNQGGNRRPKFPQLHPYYLHVSQAMR